MRGRHRRGNLPVELSSLVGRAEDVAAVRRILGRSRLVTLTGVGGVGKTRLARRAADLVQREYPDGAWFVELASLTDGAFVAEAMAGALRIPELSGREPAEALAAYLADRELLLVVDNCEHLVDACASLLTELLRLAPRLHVLATSRERLGIPGETVYPVAPLRVAPTPDPADPAAGTSSALALLLARAEESSAHLDLSSDNLAILTEVCRSLDGLPLAIELAAARLRSLSPRELADRLDDRFRLLKGSRLAAPRQATLRGAVEWSYELCTKEERQVWSRLSVFAGDVELAAAEEVCSGPGLEPEAVSEAVFGLVDKSVLVPLDEGGRRRLGMLATLREYGRVRLREDHLEGLVDSPGEEAVAARHLAWYAGLAAAFEREWFGPDQQAWLARTAAELPNIRAALEFSLTRPRQVPVGQRLAADLLHFWNTGPRREGVGWLTRLVEARPEPSRELVHDLSALCWLCSTSGLPEDALRYGQEAAALVEEHAPELVPRVQHNVGIQLTTRLDPAALGVVEQAVVRAKGQVGETSGEAAYALFCLGFCLATIDEAGRSGRVFAESAEICRRAGEQWWLGWVRLTEAFFAWNRGDRDHLAEVVIEVLPSARRLPDRHQCATALSYFALTCVGRDDERGAYLLGMCERYWVDAGGSVLRLDPMATVLEHARRTLRDHLGEDAYVAAHRAGEEDPLEAGIALVLGEDAGRAREPEPDEPGADLTRRESEVAGLLAEGLSNREIAARLVLSTRTVETHVQNILTKTGFTSRIQVAVWFSGRRDG